MSGLFRKDAGASLVEYALLLALIAMVCIAAVTALGDTTSTSFSEATSLLD
jgi:pilus assembly protein Flp/PilA